MFVLEKPDLFTKDKSRHIDLKKNEIRQSFVFFLLRLHEGETLKCNTKKKEIFKKFADVAYWPSLERV